MAGRGRCVAMAVGARKGKQWVRGRGGLEVGANVLTFAWRVVAGQAVPRSGACHPWQRARCFTLLPAVCCDSALVEFSAALECQHAWLVCEGVYPQRLAVRQPRARRARRVRMPSPLLPNSQAHAFHPERRPKARFVCQYIDALCTHQPRRLYIQQGPTKPTTPPRASAASRQP